MESVQSNITPQTTRRAPRRFRLWAVVAVALLSLAAAVAAGLVVLIPVVAALFPGAKAFGFQETAVWLFEDSRVVLISGALILAALFLHWLDGRLILSNSGILKNQDCPNCVRPDLEQAGSRRRDRFVGRLTGLPVDHYSCGECGWHGLCFVANNERSSTPGYEETTDSVENPPLFEVLVDPIPGAGYGMSPDASLKSMAMSLVLAGDAQQVGNTSLGTAAFEQSAVAAALPVTAESDLVQTVGSSRRRGVNQLLDYATRPFPVAIFYLVVLTLAEVIAVLVSPVAGVLLHMMILFILILHAAFTWALPIHRFLLALTLLPLIRVISLSLPLVQFPLTYWFFITSVPLFSAAYVIMRELDFTWRDVFGSSWRGLPLQLLIGISGLLLGFVEYVILEPEPLIEIFSWQAILLPALILLISTGFLEEFIFRFLLQRTSIERLGVAWGIAYVAIFFAVLHIGYRSVPDFLFVLLVGLIFGWLAYRTGSIVGVTLAHGLTNIVLFLVMPFLVVGSALPFESEMRELCEMSGLAPETCQMMGLEQQDGDAFQGINAETAADFLKSVLPMFDDLNQELSSWWFELGLFAPEGPEIPKSAQIEKPVGAGFRIIDYGEAVPDDVRQE